MRKCLALLAILAIPAAPAMAQSTTQTQPAAEKPKTVTKVVCERIRSDRTGSRTGPTEKVCKKVEVAAPESKNQNKPQGQSAPND